MNEGLASIHEKKGIVYTILREQQRQQILWISFALLIKTSRRYSDPRHQRSICHSWVSSFQQPCSYRQESYWIIALMWFEFKVCCLRPISLLRLVWVWDVWLTISFSVISRNHHKRVWLAPGKSHTTMGPLPARLLSHFQQLSGDCRT